MHCTESLNCGVTHSVGYGTIEHHGSERYVVVRLYISRIIGGTDMYNPHKIGSKKMIG